MTSDESEDYVTYQMGVSTDGDTDDNYASQEYHSLSVQAFCAAETLDDNYSNPIFMLLSYSLELSLKSFLSAKDFDADLLRRDYGHDIEKLLVCCQNQGLSLTEKTLYLIKMHFYDKDPDRSDREFFSSLSVEEKEKIKLQYGKYIHEIVNACKKEKEKVPYGIQLILAYVYDDKNAKSKIDSKEYITERRRINRFTDIRYSMENIFPSRHSSLRAIQEVIDATNPKLMK